MNPVLPFLRHNNKFLTTDLDSSDCKPQHSGIAQKVQLADSYTTYGPLIPPSSGISRAVMGNSSSSGRSDPAMQQSDKKSLEQSQKSPAQQPRSNLSVLMEQEKRQRLGEASGGSCVRTTPLSVRSPDEADSASGPTVEKAVISLPVACPPVNPPVAIPSPSTLVSPAGEAANPDKVCRVKERRCMSSKDLGTLAPPSGSPYTFMLQQKEMIELRMTERLQQTRDNENFRSHTSSPLTLPDDSSISSKSRMARNEARNCRRAEHNRAVIEELCAIVADLYIAESKLLNPSQYGLDSSIQREHVLQAVERFVGSLPPRYALGAETPSEVLLHMRLMAAVRSEPSKAAVHIMSLDDTQNSSFPAPLQGQNRRLVTIVCADANGLLEYITKLLGTGGSRVLDADVMLSTDSIAVDRFVVEMHGRLRLDKLATYIERFLQESTAKNGNNPGLPKKLSSLSSFSNQSARSNEFSGSLYYHTSPSTNKLSSALQINEEIKSAVPLTDILGSGIGCNFDPSSESNNGCFKPLQRHLSMPSKLPSAFPVKESALMEDSCVAKIPDCLSANNSDHHLATDDTNTKQSETQSLRQQRRLVKREGTSDFDRVDHDDNGEEGGNLSVDYVTMDACGSAFGTNRNIPIIPFDELMLIETLGTGRVSTIYRAAWRRSAPCGQVALDSTQMVALKVAMVNPDTLDTSHIDEVRREADIAARLEHPNICDLVGIAADSECFCLAYEFCEGGSLLSLLSDSTRYYEYLPIALDIANGMAYLHSRNVIHRDLKPSNILLTRDHRAKIADFGMSVANTGQELTAETGTYRYMAPEVIRHESYSSNADVYSFGICLWQLITREVPFVTMTPIQAAYAIAEGRRPPIPDSTPQRLREIISACWEQDSNKRPSFTYVAMALADYVKMAFSPANVGAQTLQIANDMLANVEGNSTVNVDFTTFLGAYMYPEMGQGSTSSIGLEI